MSNNKKKRMVVETDDSVSDLHLRCKHLKGHQVSASRSLVEYDFGLVGCHKNLLPNLNESWGKGELYVPRKNQLVALFHFPFHVRFPSRYQYAYNVVLLLLQAADRLLSC